MQTWQHGRHKWKRGVGTQMNPNPHATFTTTIYHLMYSSSQNLMPWQREAYSALPNTQISPRKTTHRHPHRGEEREEMNTNSWRRSQVECRPSGERRATQGEKTDSNWRGVGKSLTCIPVSNTFTILRWLCCLNRRGAKCHHSSVVALL